VAHRHASGLRGQQTALAVCCFALGRRHSAQPAARDCYRQCIPCGAPGQPSLQPRKCTDGAAAGRPRHCAHPAAPLQLLHREPRAHPCRLCGAATSVGACFQPQRPCLLTPTPPPCAQGTQTAGLPCAAAPASASGFALEHAPALAMGQGSLQLAPVTVCPQPAAAGGLAAAAPRHAVLCNADGTAQHQQRRQRRGQQQQQQQQQQQLGQKWRPRIAPRALPHGGSDASSSAYRQEQAELVAAMLAAPCPWELGSLVTGANGSLDEISASAALTAFARLVAADPPRLAALRAAWRAREQQQQQQQQREKEPRGSGRQRQQHWHQQENKVVGVERDEVAGEGQEAAEAEERAEPLPSGGAAPVPRRESQPTGGVTADGLRLLRLHALLLRLVLDRAPAFRVRQLANCLHALGKLHCRDKEAVEQLLASSGPQLRFAGPQELANSVWALGTLWLWPPREWLAAWFAASGELLHAAALGGAGSGMQASTRDARRRAFNGQELANMAWGLGRLRVVPPAAWVEAFLAAAGGQLSSLSPQLLANMIWGLASMANGGPRYSVGGGRGSSGVGGRSGGSGGSGGGGDVSGGSSASSSSAGGFELPHEWVLAVCETAESKLGAFTTVELSSLLWAMASIWQEQAGAATAAEERHAAEGALRRLAWRACSALAWHAAGTPLQPQRRGLHPLLRHQYQQQQQQQQQQQEKEQEQERAPTPNSPSPLRPHVRPVLRRPPADAAPHVHGYERSGGGDGGGIFGGAGGAAVEADLRPLDIVRALTLCAVLQGAIGPGGAALQASAAPGALHAAANGGSDGINSSSTGGDDGSKGAAPGLVLPPALLAQLAAVLLRASVRRGYARRPAASWDLCSGLRLLQLLGHVPSGAFLVRALEEVHEHLPCMRLSDHCAVAAALLAWGYAPPAAWASDFMAAASRVLGTGHEGLHGAQAGRGGASWAAPAGRTAGRVTAQRVGVILRFAAASAAAAGGPGAIWCGDAAAAAAWARAALSASSRAAAAEPSGAAAATTVALALVHLPGFAACGYITGSSSSSSASSSASSSRSNSSSASSSRSSSSASSSGAAAAQPGQAKLDEDGGLAAWAAQLPADERCAWLRLLQQWRELRPKAAPPRLHAAACAAATALEWALRVPVAVSIDHVTSSGGDSSERPPGHPEPAVSPKAQHTLGRNGANSAAAPLHALQQHAAHSALPSACNLLRQQQEQEHVLRAG
jgi:hypothetical protein